MASDQRPESDSRKSDYWRSTGERFSRKFSSNKSDRLRSPLYTQADDYFSTTGNSKHRKTRSRDFASPLEFVDENISGQTQSLDRRLTHSPLTLENLQSLEAVQERLDLQSRSTPNSPPRDSDSRFEDPQLRSFMRTKSSTAKSRLPEKRGKGKSQPGSKRNSRIEDHPLNLPPEQLKRFSARMAQDTSRKESSRPVDTDADMADSSDTGTTNGADAGSSPSNPPSPSAQDAPGAFPTLESRQTNGDHETLRDATASPPPPPHRVNKKKEEEQKPKVDPEACKAAGNKFFKAKDYDRAIEEYSKAVEADPHNPTYLSNRSAAYISANKYTLALQDSLQASTFDPNNNKILHRLARIYTSLGRPDDALNTYKRIPNASAADTAAAQKAKRSIEIAETQIRAQNGDGKQALWNIDQAKQTLGYGTPMPRTWQLLRAKANLKIGTSNSLGEVQSVAQSFMRDNSQDAEALTLLGQSLYLRDEKPPGTKSDYQRAEQCFKQALQSDPDASAARDSLRLMRKLENARNDANTLYKSGSWQAAADAYTSCLEIDPLNKLTNAKILGNRALARSKLNLYDDAKSDCDAALKLDPTYLKARRTRAKITGESGDWESAVKDLKTLVDENQGDRELAKELQNAELELKKSKRKDWYKILGVGKDAGEKEIERAYKKKAAVLHPDKTQGDKEKEEMFKDCLEAKETLLDPQKRQIYDSGADLMEPGMGGMGGHPFGGMGGMGGGVQIDPEMLFNMMGGMGGGRGGGFPGGGFSFSTGGPGMGGGRGGFPFG